MALMHDAALYYDNTGEDHIGNTPSPPDVTAVVASEPKADLSPALHAGHHVRCRGRGNEWRRIGGADPFSTRHAADITCCFTSLAPHWSMSKSPFSMRIHQLLQDLRFFATWPARFPTLGAGGPCSPPALLRALDAGVHRGRVGAVSLCPNGSIPALSIG